MAAAVAAARMTMHRCDYWFIVGVGVGVGVVVVFIMLIFLLLLFLL